MEDRLESSQKPKYGQMMENINQETFLYQTPMITLRLKDAVKDRNGTSLKCQLNSERHTIAMYNKNTYNAL